METNGLYNGRTVSLALPYQVGLNLSYPLASALFAYDTQCHRLYERLLEGPITNAEIVRGLGIFNSTGRISDIRAALKPYCVDVVARRIQRGLFEYRLRG
jgi:hypothetical protein